MASITEFYIQDGKIFLTLGRDLKEKSNLNLGKYDIKYRVISSNKLLILLSDLKQVLEKSSQSAHILTLNDDVLRYTRILKARESFRYFKIYDDKFLFFDNQGIMATISISDSDLTRYLNRLNTKKVKKVHVDDKMMSIYVGDSWIYQVTDILLYQNNKRVELSYYIDENEASIHIALDSIKTSGVYRLCLDINNNERTDSYFLDCEDVGNQSSYWIVNNKGLSLISKALAINFDSKDIGVINYTLEKNKVMLSLLSDEVLFEKVIAKDQNSGETYELRFVQEGKLLQIDIDEILQIKSGNYIVQGVFFDINFTFYTSQSLGKKINLSNKVVYFSKDGLLSISDDGSDKVLYGNLRNQDADSIEWYQHVLLTNSIALVSNCTSLENRTVSRDELYKYPDSKYVSKNIRTRKLIETIFQNEQEYSLIFNEDVNIKHISLVHKKIKSEISLPFVQSNKRKITIKLDQVFGYFGDVRADYDLVFDFRDNDELKQFAVAAKEMKGKPEWQRYYDAEIVPNRPKNNIAARLYFDKNGKICMLNRAILPTDEFARNLPIKPKIDAITKKGNYLQTKVSYTRDKIKPFDKYLSVENVYLYKTINQNEKLNLKIDNIMESSVTVSISLMDLVGKDRLGHYVMVLVVRSMGKIFHVKVVEPSKEYANKLLESRFVFSQKINGVTRVVLPKLGGPKDFTFFFDNYKPIDSKRSISMENLATKKYKSGKVKEMQDKYIIFEKEANYAEDNGFALFEWIQQNIPNNNSYYVINKDSPHISKLESYKDHLLYPGTYNYFKHLLSSKAVIGSENPIHLYDGDRAKISPFMNKVMLKKQVVFLQHGVTAMKNISKFKNFRADSNVIDYFVATNQDEKMIIHKNLGYDYFRIPVLGFARWDKFDFKLKKSNTILYVPTNRQWLVKATDEEFMNSDYYQGILNLITNEEMVRILQENDLKLQVFVHPLMQKFTKTITSLSPLVEVLSIENNDLGALLRTADLLITDYSSVAWDFAVQRKPVIFYQFDREEYEKKVGSFIDLKTIPIGHSFVKADNVVGDVKSVLRNDFVLDHEIGQKVDELFGRQKNDICERTYYFIRKISK